MSAPAGWYPTPEGQERYWDGDAWTDQMREATPTPDPAATQVLPQAGEPTVAIPPMQQMNPYAAPGLNPYAAPGQQPYGAPGEQAPYGTPGQGTPPPKKGKGCLIAGIIVGVLVLIIAALAVWGIFAAKSKVDEVVSSITASLTPTPTSPAPTSEAPSPTDTSAPSPTNTTAPPEGTTYPIGAAFTAGDFQIQQGWKVQKAVGSLSTIEGMKATANPGSVAGTFTMYVVDGDKILDQTLCAVDGSTGSSPFEVVCIPLTKDISNAQGVRITNGIGM